MYLILGDFTYPDLPVDNLVDITEMVYYKRISPISFIGERTCFNSETIEAVAIEVYDQISKLEHQLESTDNFLLDDNSYPLLVQKYQYYHLENPHLEKNKIIDKFLDSDNRKALFILSLYPFKGYADKLDSAFREFYFEYRYISFICKHIFYESIHFDKKLRKKNQRESIILDNPIKDEGTPLIEIVAADHQQEKSVTSPLQFVDMLENDTLYQSFKKLNLRQQEILFMTYVRQYKDHEIAKVLSVSPQAVSKNRRNAINILRMTMEVERYG